MTSGLLIFGYASGRGDSENTPFVKTMVPGERREGGKKPTKVSDYT
jgi:hypothetical protein